MRAGRPLLGTALLLLATCGGPADDGERPLNVLLVIVDDLRATTAVYGEPDVHAPAIDRLADEGVTFLRAYAQQALCAPSRASMFTGVRPESSGVFDLTVNYRDVLPDVVALPELFVRHGYEARAFGKVHHGKGHLDDLQAWSVPPWRPTGWQATLGTPAKRERVATIQRISSEHGEKFDPSRYYSADEAPDEALLPDREIADSALAALRDLRDQPFFLAVGFLKPHLPYVAPRRYWELYPPAAVAGRTGSPRPAGASALAIGSNEVMGYVDVAKDGVIDAEEARELRRGYLACVSWVDSLLGELLDELDALHLADDTVVVLIGDNGWHMGEQEHWGKDSVFELDVRVPLIVRAPGRGSPGATTGALVELVDLYPTLAALAGLPAPGHLEGASFAPVLDDPDRPWKTAAFSVVQRDLPGGALVLGRSMRTETHRLVEWLRRAGAAGPPELYPYGEGPLEGAECSRAPDEVARLAALRAQLAAGWRGAAPDS